ncbi:MAG: RNA polymerase sigma-70 factor [Bacteroidetes bacterium]|nr:RNA polymerase sigma-70 factor [Bacteroidota bacterium]
MPEKIIDKQSFQVVFNEYYTSLCRFAVSFLGDNDSAEEIVQQVFVNLWEKRNTIDQDKSVKTYLFTSVKNRSLNYIRDNKKYRSYYLDFELEMEIPVEGKDVVSESDLNNQINRALDKLPDKCREVFMLCRFEDMKYKEVAEKLGISQKTVEAQMSKALKILREELKDYFVLLLIWYWGNLN